MANRCRICGGATNDVTICNFCNTAAEERRFFKMVNREELKADRRVLKGHKKTPRSHAVAPK